MYYSTRSGSINTVLLVTIGIALFALVAWLGYNAGLNAAEGLVDELPPAERLAAGVDTYLTSISLAENAGLELASGVATIDASAGRLLLDVVLPDGVTLPEGAVLEGWLVDAGTAGGLGQTSASEEDQRYGTPFANVDFTASVASAPYALSLGALSFRPERGSFHLFYETANNFTPYDAVMVTLESDGNGHDYDPRPGTPMLIGEITK